MKRTLSALLSLIASAAACHAQASGNIGYSQSGGNSRAEQNERAKRTQTKEEMPPTGTSMFLDASVLMNVKADEHVAVFGVARECATVPECNQKMDSTVGEFSAALRQLGVKPADVFVDFAAQNKIYGYEVAGTVAKEKLVGFELKKNVSVHYQDKALLDRLIVAASRSNIFDLIKVDYVVRDTARVRARLMEEAAGVVNRKAEGYTKLFGVRFRGGAQVYAEKYSAYYPTEMYDSYTAFESEEMGVDYYRQRYTIQGARKSRTFFFNPLNADGFDLVFDPVVIEPVVQFTLFLRLKYEIEQPAPTQAAP
jgi:uncharacterized protein YggE